MDVNPESSNTSQANGNCFTVQAVVEAPAGKDFPPPYQDRTGAEETPVDPWDIVEQKDDSAKWKESYNGAIAMDAIPESSKATQANTSRHNFQVSVDDAADNDFPPPYPEKADAEETPVDPWDIVEQKDDSVKWKDLTWRWKIWRLIWITIRICIIIGLLYFFICSLDVLQDAFQLLAGRTASSVFANNVLINNPVSALMIGVLVTVLVQSSSTSTSIVVSMVGSDILTVQQAIPIVMGANIGTTVTNTIVALTQSADKDFFRRAFAGATVHDAFNWLTVLILLPVECITHYLYYMTYAMTENITPVQDLKSPQFLSVVTSPLTDLIVELDKKVLMAIAEQKDRAKFPIAKYFCDEVKQNYTFNLTSEDAQLKYEEVKAMTFTYNLNLTADNGTNTSILQYDQVLEDNSTQCNYLFHGTGMPDSLAEAAAGGILLIGSLLVMSFSLIIMVKVLNSLLKGPMAKIVRKVVNAEFPGHARHFTGYVAILVGAGITVIFQSSSVFTSTLTPLVGIGVITVERVYPLTLGSNIGTTVSSILAALAADSSKIRYTLQISFCHLFFNITGIVIFYPIPFMRKIPISIAKRLGMTTAKYRWFAVLYLIITFFIFPLIVFGLSMAGWYVLVAVGVPFLLLVAFVVVVNILQKKRPNWLPKRLRTWDWLPKPLRSLEPYDRVITICCRSKKCCCNKNRHDTISMAESTNRKETENEVALEIDNSNSNGIVNTAYDELREETVSRM